MFRRKLRWLLGTCMLLALGLTVGAQQNQPAYQVQAVVPGGSQEHYAPNLGIYYEFIPYSPYGGGGYNPSSPPGYGGYQASAPAPYPTSAYGARLTRYPVPNSPATYLQLEPGDMIISLDNLPFRTPNDVLSHQYQTSMVFINVRTGLPQSSNIYIP